jgi:GNAT superfamily N-acetyltransferase
VTRSIERVDRVGEDADPRRREHLLDAAHDVWMEALRHSWPIEREMLGRYAEDGFVLMDGDRALGLVLFERAPDKGSINDIVVRPDARRQGIGKALLRRALQEITHTSRGRVSWPPPDYVTLGGGYHYLWPGIPDGLAESRGFFDAVLGWPFSEPSYDMTMRLDGFSPPAELYRRPAAAGITFRLAAPDDMPQIIAFEELHFFMWTRYARNHAPEDIVVGVDGGRQVVAALVLDMPPIVWSGVFGSSAAEIGAVGVDPSRHNLGIGTGLVARACEFLRDRGVEVAVLRWLYRVNFYHRVGFRVSKQYLMSSKAFPAP